MSKIFMIMIILSLQLGILLLFQNKVSSLLSSDSQPVKEQFCDSQTNASVSEAVLRQPKCEPESSEFVVLVHSAILNIENRNILRKHAQYYPNFRIIFVLGIGNIDGEARSHKDILQGNFVDSYRNLTRKHLFGLSWTVNCYTDPEQWILKIDDDIFVNFPAVQTHFEKLRERQTLKKHYILGFVHDRMTVIRQPSSKWFVTQTEFTHDYYPEFVSGWAYLTRLSTVKVLLNAERQNKVGSFWIDDVYITGIVRTKSCVRLFAINHLLNVDIPRIQQWLRGERTTFAVFFSNIDGDLRLMDGAFQRIK